MSSSNKVVYHPIGAVKGQERGHVVKVLAIFVGIFVVLTLGVKFGNELGTKTFVVGTEDSTPPTVFTPPDANFEKVDTGELSTLFRKSSYTCTKDPDVNKVCVFQNLVLYQGELLYIVEYPEDVSATVMPNPTVFDLEAETLSIVDYAVPNIVHPVTAESLELRIKSSTTKKSINVARYERAMFQRVRSLTNWYWAMNSISNTFHRLCDQMGACTQREVHEVALLQPATYSEKHRTAQHLAIRTGQHSSASDELKGCLGPMFWVDHPRMHNPSEWVSDEIVVMESVHFGVGKTVVQPNVALELNKNVFAFGPTSVETGQKRIEFLRRCASLPPVPPITDKPSVVLINRPFGDGRSIIGLDHVYDRL